MTEIAVPAPLARRPLRVLQTLAALAGLALVSGGVAALSHRPHAAAPPQARPHPFARRAPMRGAAAHAAVSAARAAAAAEARAATAIGADAAHAFDRGFLLASPGGIEATAARVAQWKPLIVRAARGSGIDPDLVEGMVLVESSGRPSVTAGARAGLTQLSPDRARSLGLPVRRRFVPAAELRATVRYLVRARHALRRADLAVASFHIGVRKLAFAHGRSYAQLYFGPAYGRLGAQRDYYWKVLAAERLLRVYRHDPGALGYEAEQQARKNSAEEVLHPRSATPQFLTPNQIAWAWQHHVLRAIPLDTPATHIAISGTLGQEAHKLGRSRRLYRGLRPVALDVLLYIGREVHALSGARRLVLTSAVRDDRYQRVLQNVNVNAARTYSMHTTGYAFDLARDYSSGRQRRAFQLVLDRLAAVDAIAYIREATAIHVAVASDATRKLALLTRG